MDTIKEVSQSANIDLEKIKNTCLNQWNAFFSANKRAVKIAIKKQHPKEFKELKFMDTLAIEVGDTPKFKKYRVKGMCGVVPMFFRKGAEPSYVLYNQDFSEELWLTDTIENAWFCTDNIRYVKKELIYDYRFWHESNKRCFALNDDRAVQYAVGHSVANREFVKNNMNFGLPTVAYTLMNLLGDTIIPKGGDITVIDDINVIIVHIRKVFLKFTSGKKMYIGVYNDDENHLSIDQSFVIS